MYLFHVMKFLDASYMQTHKLYPCQIACSKQACFELLQHDQRLYLFPAGLGIISIFYYDRDMRLNSIFDCEYQSIVIWHKWCLFLVLKAALL